MKRYSEIFAKNLHRLRKSMHLTQEQLAEKICYTEKAVSKWESGSSVPPAETLILLAEIFNVTIDEMFNHCTHPAYFLGIDGGATKTDFALANAKGEILRTVTLGPTNPFDLGYEKVAEVLTEGINNVTENVHKRQISLFAGIAGCGNPEMRERVGMLLSSFGFLSARVDSDAKNIIADGLRDNDGMIVIMGTGSSCFVKKGGEESRIGGFGYLFDHGGSGYDVGNAAISAVAKMEDGRAERTILADLLYKELGTASLSECLGKIYAAGKRGIAALAPIVFAAYKAGDVTAEHILRSNAASIAELMIAAQKRLDSAEKNRTVMIGGLTKEWDVIYPFLAEVLGDKLDLFDIDVYSGNVVHGALRLAGMEDNGSR